MIGARAMDDNDSVETCYALGLMRDGRLGRTLAVHLRSRVRIKLKDRRKRKHLASADLHSRSDKDDARTVRLIVVADRPCAEPLPSSPDLEVFGVALPGSMKISVSAVAVVVGSW